MGCWEIVSILICALSGLFWNLDEMAYEYGQVVVALVSLDAYCPKPDDVAKDEDQYAERVPGLLARQSLLALSWLGP